MLFILSNSRYIDNNPQWSDRTKETKIDCINKIFRYVDIVHNVHTNINIKVQTRERDINNYSRNTMMTTEHLNQLRSDLSQSRSQNAFRGLELTYRIGSRAAETATLKYKDIDLEKHCVHLTENTKNGKSRNVPILDKDYSFFTDLKRSTQNQDNYICGSIKADSINREIRRSMQRLGIDKFYIDTTLHKVH